MRIIHEEFLINQGNIDQTEEWRNIHTEIHQAIDAVVWPPGEKHFCINPTVRHGNGVKPIKEGCLTALKDMFGWHLEAQPFMWESDNPGKVDALRRTTHGDFVFEWETGNISSSHRALNKIVLGMIRDLFMGGVLVLLTRNLYNYLTDRTGNFEELRPYFPIWKRVSLQHGLLLIVAIEHDATDDHVPLIRKGTDGRALV